MEEMSEIPWMHLLKDLVEGVRMSLEESAAFDIEGYVKQGIAGG
jgi:hypothetical protein